MENGKLKIKNSGIVAMLLLSIFVEHPLEFARVFGLR